MSNKHDNSTGPRFTTSQVADGLGLPSYRVRRAVLAGSLDADYHASKRECSPGDACSASNGPHYAILQTDAEEWLANGKSGRRSSAWLAGYNAARSEVERLFDPANAKWQRPIAEWLAQGVTDVTLTAGSNRETVSP